MSVGQRSKWNSKCCCGAVTVLCRPLGGPIWDSTLQEWNSCFLSFYVCCYVSQCRTASELQQMLCRPRMATAGAELSRNLFLLPLILSAVVVLWSEQLIREKGGKLTNFHVRLSHLTQQGAPPCGRCLTSKLNIKQITKNWIQYYYI